MRLKLKKEPDNVVFRHVSDSSKWYNLWVIFAFLGAVLVRMVAMVKL